MLQKRKIFKKTLSGKKIVKDLKSILRQKILKRLRNQKEDTRLKKSRRIQRKLFATPEFRKAKVILFYASFDQEVETFTMMKQAQRLGKQIALPRIIKDRKKIIPLLVRNLQKDLIRGPYGIKQPRFRPSRRLQVAEVDLIVAPGVAFDRDNHRLGRGAGYYDRFLGKTPPHIPIFGLAFDFQIVKSLPHHKGRDIPVRRVIVN